MRHLLILIFLMMCSVCCGVAADMAVTVAGAGDGSGTAVDGVTLEWDNAMSLAQWQTDANDIMEAGDRYFVAGGTYTLTGAWNTAREGDVTHKTAMYVIGVKTGTTAEPPTAADYAYGTARPLIVAAANNFEWEDHMIFRNLRLTSSAFGWVADGYNTWINCKSTNTDGVLDFYAWRVGAVSIFNGCEAIAGPGGNGVGFSITGTTPRLINCYAHDCTQSGIELGTHYGVVTGCIVEDNTDKGIWFRTDFGSTYILNNVISGSTIGLYIEESYSSLFHNNIFLDCTTGVQADVAVTTNFWDYNCYHNNGTDNTNITIGSNSLLINPQFIDQANGDYRLRPSSPCLNAGYPSINIDPTDPSTFTGRSTIGLWGPWASPNPTNRRARYSGQAIYN